MQASLIRVATLMLLSCFTGSLVAISQVQEFKGTKVAFFTSTPDVIQTITVHSKKVLLCVSKCTTYVAAKTCRLVEFDHTTGECRMMGSDLASNRAKGIGWSVYKVQEKHQDWEIAINNAVVDWYGEIPTRPVQVGSNITIIGRPFTNNPGRISFELAHGPDITYDQALHMNGRFNYLGDINTVTLNSKVNKNFGTKLKITKNYPFRKGVQFEVKLQMRTRNIRIIIDGKKFLDFKHKVLPLSSISHLFVRGDMKLLQVRFQ